MIKIVVQEQENTYDMDDHADTGMLIWKLKSEITSDDKKAIAATLRAIADSYDPPKPITRSMILDGQI